MSNPTNHHSVPQCYLREFASINSKQLQVYNLKYNKLSSPKVPKQVCFEPNRFKIRKEETKNLNNILDDNIVEKQYFRIVENAYPKILEKIKKNFKQELYLSKQETYNLLKFLFSIKKRSDDFITSFMNKDENRIRIDRKIAEFLPTIKDISKRLDSLSENETIEKLEYYKSKFLNDEDAMYDNYLISLKEDEVFDRLYNYMEKFKWYILLGNPQSHFITSDRPGFTYINETGELLYIGGYGKDFDFIFPLTPQHSLLISNDLSESSDLITKPLYFIPIDSSFILEINKMTAMTAKSKLFAFSTNSFDFLQR